MGCRHIYNKNTSIRQGAVEVKSEEQHRLLHKQGIKHTHYDTCCLCGKTRMRADNGGKY